MKKILYKMRKSEKTTFQWSNVSRLLTMSPRHRPDLRTGLRFCFGYRKCLFLSEEKQWKWPFLTLKTTSQMIFFFFVLFGGICKNIKSLFLLFICIHAFKDQLISKDYCSCFSDPTLSFLRRLFLRLFLIRPCWQRFHNQNVIWNM